MLRIAKSGSYKSVAYSILLSFLLVAGASAQNLEVKRYNPSEWTKAGSAKW